MLKQDTFEINKDNFGERSCEQAGGLWDKRVKACSLASVEFIAELRDGIVKLWESSDEEIPGRHILVRDVGHLYAYDLKEYMGQRLNADFDPDWPSIYGKLGGDTLVIFKDDGKLSIRIPGD